MEEQVVKQPDGGKKKKIWMIQKMILTYKTVVKSDILLEM